MLAFLLLGLAHAGDPATGRTLFAASCTACHGLAGDGAGPAAAALERRPPDFRSHAFQTSRTDDQLGASIRAGRPGTPMAGFTQLSDAEVDDLVAFVRSLGSAP